MSQLIPTLSCHRQLHGRNAISRNGQIFKPFDPKLNMFWASQKLQTWAFREHVWGWKPSLVRISDFQSKNEKVQRRKRRISGVEIAWDVSIFSYFSVLHVKNVLHDKEVYEYCQSS